MRKVTAARLKHFFRSVFDWRYDRAAGRAAIPPKTDERARVPFGIAIALGTWATLVLEAILTWR
jgi:prepilin signal peptidase PulO-like enzyme (type II secretory pathway)